jgi:hypothetical protein
MNDIIKKELNTYSINMKKNGRLHKNDWPLEQMGKNGFSKVAIFLLRTKGARRYSRAMQKMVMK